MNDAFIFYDNASDSFIVDVPERDPFRMWQGLVGPHYTPYVDAAGNLSWTNNGGLVNPETVNIQGKGLEISGIVDDVTDLPESAPSNSVYLVGTESPYEGYLFLSGSWTDIGEIGLGPQGPEGPTGPEGPEGPTGPSGPGVASGGTTGQILKKKSGTNYDTEWADNIQPASNAPIVDGTAAVGTSAKYAKEDHVHPTDTSRVAKAGDTMTGALNAPILATGADAANYFQTQKLRGEGDASTYYHAIDFGYASHNQVDFYEYGGLWNFYLSDQTPAVGVGSIQSGYGWRGLVEGRNVVKFLTTVGSVSLSTTWTETSSGSGVWTQTVTVSDGTSSTKVDLQPDAATIAQLLADGVKALYIENNAGTFTAYAIGTTAPTTAMTIQTTLVEVDT